MGYPVGLGQVSVLSRMGPRALQLPANIQREVRMPPSVEDVKRHLYGSVEKFDAANQASIDEARQRQQEMARIAPPTRTYLPPVGLTPEDMEPPTETASPTEDMVEVEEGGDADAIEEAAEYGEEEEFSGWLGGFDERIVGVTDRLRRQVPAMHVRRQQSLVRKLGRRRPNIRRR